jgi:hypothetical protein
MKYRHFCLPERRLQKRTWLHSGYLLKNVIHKLLFLLTLEKLIKIALFGITPKEDGYIQAV